ncbi:MAG: hypothetical protein ABSC56_14135 [Solirubrobacteraceae bacterium]
MLGALARRISGPPPPPNAPALEQLRFIRRAFLRWAVPTAALAAVVLATAAQTAAYIGVGVIALTWIAGFAVIQARIGVESQKHDS